MEGNTAARKDQEDRERKEREEERERKQREKEEREREKKERDERAQMEYEQDEESQSLLYLGGKPSLKNIKFETKIGGQGVKRDPPPPSTGRGHGTGSVCPKEARKPGFLAQEGFQM